MVGAEIAAGEGIGFTVALPVGELAFPQAASGEQFKAAVLIASLASALLAALILRRLNRIYRRLYEEENTDADADGIPDLYQRAAPTPTGADRSDAAIMLEAGESVVTLARWLGHSPPAITLGYYAQFMPEAGSKGRHRHRRTALGSGEIGMPTETPQMLPRLVDG
ncbi:Na+/H+ antiporter NhaA [Streptomyces sp. NPDC049687]|uniref:Na+/H+ antiporter NhaA n=1 Tax=Streptomyces sp. NPDC049687 TaxID=3365596 RepID=UPI0037A9F562